MLIWFYEKCYSYCVNQSQVDGNHLYVWISKISHKLKTYTTKMENKVAKDTENYCLDTIQMKAQIANWKPHC